MRHLWTMPLSALLLSGCVSLLPSYNVEIADNVDATNESLAKMGALYEVSPTVPPFDQFRPLYIDAIASITLAETIAQSQSEIYAGKPSAGAMSAIRGAIGNCKKALLAQATHHRDNGLDKTSFEDGRARGTCTTPKVMEDALKERDN